MNGACYNRVYHYNGVEYPIMGHGFAWTSQFTFIKDEDACIKVTENFCDNDAYVFDGQKLDIVSICHEDKTPYVTMRSEGFPYFGIWTKPGAPYICLEPWQGRCDVHGFTGELKDKDGIHVLKAGESEVFSYIIEIA